MRQKSSPDFFTLQCLPEDTKEFQTDHTCLTTMTVICFLNVFFSFASFFPLPPQLYYQTYHPAERPSLTDWIVFYLHCPPCHRPFLHLTVQIHLCSSPSLSPLPKALPSAGLDIPELCNIDFEKAKCRLVQSWVSLHIEPQHRANTAEFELKIMKFLLPSLSTNNRFLTDYIGHCF